MSSKQASSNARLQHGKIGWPLLTRSRVRARFCWQYKTYDQKSQKRQWVFSKRHTPEQTKI